LRWASVVASWAVGRSASTIAGPTTTAASGAEPPRILMDSLIGARSSAACGKAPDPSATLLARIDSVSDRNRLVARCSVRLHSGAADQRNDPNAWFPAALTTAFRAGRGGGLQLDRHAVFFESTPQQPRRVGAGSAARLTTRSAGRIKVDGRLANRRSLPALRSDCAGY